MKRVCSKLGNIERGRGGGKEEEKKKKKGGGGGEEVAKYL